MLADPGAAKIAQFLIDIGLTVRLGEMPDGAFVPGIGIEHGVIVVDEARMTYPGDLLHEAGHLAVMPPEERTVAGPDMGDDGGFEMAAIAWSYAAALHLGIDPAVVFHPAGYRGGSQAILDNFAAGHYFGVPILQWLEMTSDYPRIDRWLRK